MISCCNEERRKPCPSEDTIREVLFELSGEVSGVVLMFFIYHPLDLRNCLIYYYVLLALFRSLSPMSLTSNLKRGTKSTNWWVFYCMSFSQHFEGSFFHYRIRILGSRLTPSCLMYMDCSFWKFNDGPFLLVR